MGCACRHCACTLAWTLVALWTPYTLHECVQVAEHMLACCIQVLDALMPTACLSSLRAVGFQKTYLVCPHSQAMGCSWWSWQHFYSTP